jgi:hypothetical protein
MPVSLGYTNQDPGAFMNHSTLGPCYVEQNTNRDGILFIFKLNDAVEILRRQCNEDEGRKVMSEEEPAVK